MTTRKFHKRVIRVTVLSEEPLEEGTLESLHHQITEGDCSGEVEWGADQEITGRQAAKALQQQGSSPEFFGIDSKGNDDGEAV